MNIVYTAQRWRITKVMQQMTEIVQECCRDQIIADSFGLRLMRRLQRVFKLRHRLTGILLASALGEQLINVCKRQHGATPIKPTAGNRS